jgi:tetratricopeptide (TPR) repeat protein
MRAAGTPVALRPHGEHRQALAYCERALDLHREMGNRYGEGATRDSLGYIHHQLGDYRRATDCYREALAIQRQVSDRHGEADILTHLGDTRDAAGDADAARRAWCQALDILDHLGHPDADAVRAKLDRPV